MGEVPDCLAFGYGLNDRFGKLGKHDTLRFVDRHPIAIASSARFRDTPAARL